MVVRDEEEDGMDWSLRKGGQLMRGSGEGGKEGGSNVRDSEASSDSRKRPVNVYQSLVTLVI